jgi:hypothetical protein
LRFSAIYSNRRASPGFRSRAINCTGYSWIDRGEPRQVIHGDRSSLNDRGGSRIFCVCTLSQLVNDAVQAEGAGGYQFFASAVDGYCLRTLLCLFAIVPNENPNQFRVFIRNEVVRICCSIHVRRIRFGDCRHHRERIWDQSSAVCSWLSQQSSLPPPH